MDQDTHVSTPAPAPAPTSNVSHNTVMGILCYLGILVIIPLLVAKEDPFVKFHAKQGLVLLIIEIVLWVLTTSFLTLWMIFNLIQLGILVLIILGIVNVVKGEQKELPLVGSLARHFKF